MQLCHTISQCLECDADIKEMPYILTVTHTISTTYLDSKTTDASKFTLESESSYVDIEFHK